MHSLRIISYIFFYNSMPAKSQASQSPECNHVKVDHTSVYKTFEKSAIFINPGLRVEPQDFCSYSTSRVQDYGGLQLCGARRVPTGISRER